MSIASRLAGRPRVWLIVIAAGSLTVHRTVAVDRADDDRVARGTVNRQRLRIDLRIDRNQVASGVAELTRSIQAHLNRCGRCPKRHLTVACSATAIL